MNMNSTKLFFGPMGVAVLALGLSLANGSCALAEYLNIQPRLEPDIAAFFILVDYKATYYGPTTGRFTAVGYPSDVDFDRLPPPDYAIADGQYSIDMKLNNVTGRPIDGSLTITGTIDALGMAGTLLTGNILAFGFSDSGGDIFDFAFTATGGALKPHYSPSGGIILDSWGSGFNGSFKSDFTNDQSGGFDVPWGLGVADTFLSPEPSALMAWTFLGPAGLAYGIYAWRRRRKSTWECAFGS